MGPTLSRARRNGSAAGKAGGAYQMNEANRGGGNVAALDSWSRGAVFFSFTAEEKGLDGLRNGIAEDERNEENSLACCGLNRLDG